MQDDGTQRQWAFLPAVCPLILPLDYTREHVAEHWQLEPLLSALACLAVIPVSTGKGRQPAVDQEIMVAKRMRLSNIQEPLERSIRRRRSQSRAPWTFQSMQYCDCPWLNALNRRSPPRRNLSVQAPPYDERTGAGRSGREPAADQTSLACAGCHARL